MKYDINTTISCSISLSWRTALLIIAPVCWGSSKTIQNKFAVLVAVSGKINACLMNNDLALRQEQQIMDWSVYDKQLDTLPDNMNNKIAQ